MVALPCSICDAKFENAKDLGTHILQQHCKDVPSTTTPSSPPPPVTECKKEPVEIQTEKSIVMDVDPLVVEKVEEKEAPVVLSTPKEMDESLDDTILPVLPRAATMEEQKQRFLMYNLPSDPPNFMRYVCLLCSKLYTSRYNIRMHLNTHSGRNVHTCPYCSIQFISRQSYESHLKSHTEDDSITTNSEVEKPSGLQIVSVQSISTPNSSLNEEIQIEPDIIEDDLEINESKLKVVKACHTLPMTAPTKPSLQIRPLSQMQHAFESQQAPLKGPFINHNCSFCNSKLGSQDLLLQHLSQHLNFHGAKPKADDLEKGFMSFNVPSQIQKGAMKIKYMCLSCGKLFGKEPQVKIHLNVHYGDNIYNCRFCEKVFASYNAFEEHVKSHSEEYKFNCKFCGTSFINRNVMVTHQRNCSFNTDPEDPVPEKKIKLVLNGESLKDFIKAKDQEMLEKQSQPPTLTIVPVLNNNEVNDGAAGVVKEVVRKRAPIFPFEPEDHYIPDNNSNNIIPKEEIVPPPTTIEKKQGYCLRPFRETGQQRYICTVCGKHYTTMYNMRQHRNIHTGSGLHCCRYCGRSFTHKHVWEVRIS